MRTGDSQQTSIRFGHMVDAHAGSQKVVIGKWIPGPALMPFHWTTTTGLHIEFISVGPNRWPNKLSNHILDFVVPQSIQIIFMRLYGAFDSTQFGFICRVTGLEIKDLVAFLYQP